MAKARKKGLGKGLGALLGEGGGALEPRPVASAESAPAPEALPDGSRLLYLDPRDLRPNPKQPRRVFDEEALSELAESIRRDGVQEPVLVRETAEGHELVSGERRVRASILADAARIPAVCRDVTDADMLRLGIIENIQREDLNAIELARAYQDLVDEFGWTQEQLADEVGKKRATVTNTMRLLALPGVVQEMVADGSLSMGHARALLAIEDGQAQLKAARKIVKEGLSVRQSERLAASSKGQGGGGGGPSQPDPHITHIEDQLRRALGTRVRLQEKTGGKGKIEIEYYSAEELERLLTVLRGEQKPRF